MKQDSTDATKIYISAPNVPQPTTAFLGLWVNKGDEVIWTYSPDGRSIIGYTIIKKGNK